VIVREFVIREGCHKDFELIFGSDGVWPELLRWCSEGFAETGLEQVLSVANGYKVRDYWRSHRDFEEFRRQHGLRSTSSEGGWRARTWWNTRCCWARFMTTAKTKAVWY